MSQELAHPLIVHVEPPIILHTYETPIVEPPPQLTAAEHAAEAEAHAALAADARIRFLFGTAGVEEMLLCADWHRWLADDLAP